MSRTILPAAILALTAAALPTTAANALVRVFAFTASEFISDGGSIVSLPVSGSITVVHDDDYQGFTDLPVAAASLTIGDLTYTAAEIGYYALNINGTRIYNFGGLLDGVNGMSDRTKDFNLEILYDLSSTPAAPRGYLSVALPNSVGFRNSRDLTVSMSTPVPEPAAWTLLTLGFGLTGAMLRRRRASIVA